MAGNLIRAAMAVLALSTAETMPAGSAAGEPGRTPYLLAAKQAPPGASFYYGVESSMRKVMWEAVPYKGKIGGTAQVALAGGEEESTQIVVLSLRHVKGLTARLAWTKKDCPLQAELGWQGHVKTRKPPYSVSHVGWWPDPILTFLGSVDIPAGHAESLWVILRAPRGTPPGRYKGTVTLAAAGGTSVSVELEVEVFGFDLPAKRHLPLAMAWRDGTPYIYAKSEAEKEAYGKAVQAGLLPSQLKDSGVRRLMEIRYRTTDFLLRKRVEPDNIYRRRPPNLDEVQRWIGRGMNDFNLLCMSGKKAELISTLAGIMPDVRRRGLTKHAYVYGFDEVGPNKFPAIKDVFGEVKKRWPELRTMTTAHDPTYGRQSGLDKVVDIWVPTTVVYGRTRSAIREARKAGSTVWWYTACSPKKPYANWFIEYPAIDARLLMGYMAFKFDTHGFLYYQIARWVHMDYPRPITKPITAGPLTDWDPRSWRKYNGDGSIFCAGPGGPLTTVRLENIRDGLEDYEYLWMLRRAVEQADSGAKGPPRSGWLEQARKCLAVSAPLVGSLREFTQDPNDLYAHRRRVAGLLGEWAAAEGRDSLNDGQQPPR